MGKFDAPRCGLPWPELNFWKRIESNFQDPVETLLLAYVRNNGQRKIYQNWYFCMQIIWHPRLQWADSTFQSI
jgi:hypothetical protein